MMDLLAQLQTLLFENLVEPAMYNLGMMEYVETAFDACEWFIVGVLQIGLIALLALTIERLNPVQRITRQSAQWAERIRSIRVDMIYTLIHRLGLFSLVVFFTVVPLFDALEGHLRLIGIDRPNLENWFPLLNQYPVLGFLTYLIALDFFDYWIHRAQHASNRWWALHSLHHSQQHMTVWSDNRNHLVDDFARDGIMAMAALIIGVPPGQFLWLIAFSQILQSLQHGNVRLSFGAIGDRILVSPFFHRLHHAVGTGHEGARRGCNFAVLFPIWDWMFGTADWSVRYEPTGVSDQLKGRHYGDGFWSQQWLGIKRLFTLKATS